MAMRYLIRRTQPEDLTALASELGDIEKELGPAAVNQQRNILVRHTPMKTSLYTFSSRKTPEGFVWICPSIELAAEDEDGLMELAQKYGATDFSHIGR